MKKIFFILCFIVFEICINSQTIKEFQVAISIPQADFAEDEYYYENGEGGAGNGLYAGFKFLSPINKNLYWDFNAGVMFNNLNEDLRNDWEDYIEEEFGSNADIKLEKYINIPLLAGFQFENELSPTTKLFAEANVGFNILKVTNYYVSAKESNYEKYEEKYVYDLSHEFAYKIGAGVIIQDKYTVSLNYLNLGSHKLKGKSTIEQNGESEKNDFKFDEEIPITTMNITVGMRF